MIGAVERAAWEKAGRTYSLSVKCDGDVCDRTGDNQFVVAVTAHLRKTVNASDNGNSITGFNDSIDRTKEEVLAMFDKAIAAA